jgi:hypothetical protein
MAQATLSSFGLTLSMHSWHKAIHGQIPSSFVPSKLQVGKKIIPFCPCLRFQQGQKLIRGNPFLWMDAVDINEQSSEPRCVPPTQLGQ